MPYPPREQELSQELVHIPFRHGSLTATTTSRVWKVPAGRTFYLDRVLYINPTGLVEDPTNAFVAELKRGGSAYADLTFTGAAADDTATSAAHGMTTGDGPFFVSNAGGALPTGLVQLTKYWIIVTTSTKFKFATSRANALAGTAINLTADGTGTQTLHRNIVTKVFNTDSDLVPDVGATLAVNTFLGFTADTDVLHRAFNGDELIDLVFTETGVATLPEGYGAIEGRLL